MDWNILGHDWAVDMLAQQVVRGEVRHAYLFTGPSGVGRRTLALKLAQAVNCRETPIPGQPCGVCRNCTQFAKAQHPDLTILQSEFEGANFKIDTVRDLQRQLYLSPYQAKYRIALLLRLHEATDEAQNALLKTFEEAPKSVILLAVANSGEELLPTILSRCEVLRLHPLSVDRLESELQSRWQLSPQDARRFAHVSGGRVGYALRLANISGGMDDKSRAADEKLNPLQEREARLDVLREWLSAPLRVRLVLSEKLAKKSDADLGGLRKHYMLWISFWRDVLLSATGSEVPLTNVELESEIQRLGEHLTPAEVHARLAELEHGLQQLSGNINARLLTEIITMEWPRL